MSPDPAPIAIRVVNHISAMVAYWDAEERCVFSNEAYVAWFGRRPEEMVGLHLRDLLGPLYDLNRPYILGALAGERQVFERRIPLPGGGHKDTIATYTPDVVDGKVQGFSVHVADVSLLREREAALEQALREKDAALARVEQLSRILPVCSWCRKIRGDEGQWLPLDDYLRRHAQTDFTHGICPSCATHLKG